MPRPRLHDDALRTRLLEVSSEVVSTAGPGVLTVRDVARRAGTSSSAVYALFGGREQLLRAVAEEGFRRFGQRLAAVPCSEDPARDLFALGIAYRRSALTDPHFYRVMFHGGPGGATAPDPAGGATALPTFGVLRDAVARTLREAPSGGREGCAGRAEEVALVLWGHVHGMVMLELAGLLPGDAEARAARYEASLAAVGRAALER